MQEEREPMSIEDPSLLPSQTPEGQPAPEEPADGEKDGETSKEKGLVYDLYYWLQTLVAAVTILVLLFTFVGRITRVVGDSMRDTLHDGDLLLIHSLGYVPKSGDIVVLNKTTPEATELLQGEVIVKRVIATEGQEVYIDYAANTVYVDGEALEEPYILEPMEPRANAYMRQTTFQVPEGCIFVLGDNRNGSTDSRHDLLGMIDTRYVLGHAVCILFPLSDFGAV